MFFSYVRRTHCFFPVPVCVDFIIVLYCIVDYILNLSVARFEGFPGAQVFRLVKLFRIIRSLRAVRILRAIRSVCLLLLVFR